jgi:signal transduction histidine kinase
MNMNGARQISRGGRRDFRPSPFKVTGEGPARRAPRRAQVPKELALRAAAELAGAVDADAGMARVVALLRRACAATRVEWRAATAEPEPDELRAASGTGTGDAWRVPLGDDGVLVVIGARNERALDGLAAALSPVLRRRRAEEQLAGMAMQLARRNAALEDFSALVAHELKTPLYAALQANDPAAQVERALALVDVLLEAARSEVSAGAPASVSDCLSSVLDELGAAGAKITAELEPSSPLPAEPLRIILRNLLSNALAAGADAIHVSAERRPGSWRLIVDDDGAGLADAGSYASGSGVGLGLCRRLADRFGGVLELAPRPVGGTRATLSLLEAT